MKKKRIVVALGGNALGSTPEEQLKAAGKAAKSISGLVEQGHEIIIGHGNGPQVGMIHTAFDYASDSGPHTPAIPFSECCAMSQGFIGYHLQQALLQEFKKRNLNQKAVTIVTQILVDKDDPAFLKFTKPIGTFYTKEEAEKWQKEKSFQFVEDSGRGYRRVVPSPLPRKILELEVIDQMIRSGLTVIAAGGGGIPIIETGNGYCGIDAVIDKDRACARLAIELNADVLLILTAVDNVCINFNKPDQRNVYAMDRVEVRRYIKEGQFAPGSMLPKVEACLEFAESFPGRLAVITSLKQADVALEGNVGTKITFPFPADI
ncbi:Carbamate kinase 1 [Clostridium sp. C105KSO15]|nr:Carbamate kinase 1 [Clostridium sp. C105KSO15]